MNKKHILGQFYTTKDPFNTSDAFSLWYRMVPKDVSILEPFAGAGHLFNYIPNREWVGFDIDTKLDIIKKRDTLKDFPSNFKVCITNPPYLAKNSITRKKLSIKIEREDLYLDCLDKCLQYCEYISAIIPSTFFETGLFKERLFAWDKIDTKLFSDTDVPVGVAYFIPEVVSSTKLFVNGKEVIIDKKYIPKNSNIEIKFNNDKGNINLCCIDKIKKENISISNDISSFNREKFLKNTSRSMSLVKCPIIQSDNDIDSVNRFINKWRKETRDFYLTSFKSLMECGKYRKRLSFSQFKWIVEQSLLSK